jgi:hypothetical protein
MKSVLFINQSFLFISEGHNSYLVRPGAADFIEEVISRGLNVEIIVLSDNFGEEQRKAFEGVNIVELEKGIASEVGEYNLLKLEQRIEEEGYSKEEILFLTTARNTYDQLNENEYKVKYFNSRNISPSTYENILEKLLLEEDLSHSSEEYYSVDSSSGADEEEELKLGF